MCAFVRCGQLSSVCRVVWKLLSAMYRTVRDSSSAHSEACVYASRPEDDSGHESTSAPPAKMKRDMQLARTPTKRTAMHFDGDSDNSDVGDCKASNTAGTDDEEEGDDGKDADDCDAGGKSRRFRTMKGDKRFLLPKSQVLAKPFKIFLGSQKQFRKDYECAFKAIYWETTKTKKTDVVFESIQHLEDAHQCGYPRAKANLVGASASVKNQLGKITTWTQQNNTNELKTEALTCLKVSHDAIRVLDETVASMQIIKTSVTEEKSAEAGRVRRRRGQDRGGAPRCESREATGEVADHWHRRRFGPGAEFRHTAMG